MFNPYVKKKEFFKENCIIIYYMLYIQIGSWQCGNIWFVSITVFSFLNYVKDRRTILFKHEYKKPKFFTKPFKIITWIENQNVC